MHFGYIKKNVALSCTSVMRSRCTFKALASGPESRLQFQKATSFVLSTTDIVLDLEVKKGQIEVL